MIITNLHLAAVAAVTAITVTSAPAVATSYDALADFSPTSAAGTWSYGFGQIGTSFALATVGSQCITAFDCWQPAVLSLNTPLIARNTGATFAFPTGWAPNNLLIMHPGQGSDQDAIVRFTAPVAGTYSYSAFFGLVGYDATGVQVDISEVGGFQLWGAGLTAPSPGYGIFGGTAATSGTVTLGAGDMIDFAVDNGGSYFGDSTMFNATLTLMDAGPVPEPASWAMLITGFGLTGAAMRRRQRALA